jgi:hypothetical protein
MASRQMGNIDKDTARVAGLLADHIGNYIENLQPKDLIAGSDPKAALNAWMKGKDAWRKMRTGERIANIIEGSLDTQGANYHPQDSKRHCGKHSSASNGRVV